MFRYLVFILTLLFIPFQANGCSLIFNYGPYVTKTVSESILGDFKTKVKNDTGCDMNLVSSNNVHEYFETALLKKTDFFIVPSAAGPVMEKRGYKGLFTTPKVFINYIIVDPSKVKKTDNKFNLSNASIIIGSELSLLYSFGTQYLNRRPDKPTLIPVANVFVATIDFFRKDYDGIITSSLAYNSLPIGIRNKYEIIHESDKGSNSIMISDSVPEKITEKIKGHFKVIKKIPFEAHDGFQRDYHTERLEGLISNMEKELGLSPSSSSN